MDRSIGIIALVGLLAVFFFSAGAYSAHELINNSEVIGYVNLASFRCTQTCEHHGNTTITTTEGLVDAYPDYLIKGHLKNAITFRIPVG